MTQRRWQALRGLLILVLFPLAAAGTVVAILSGPGYMLALAAVLLALMLGYLMRVLDEKVGRS